VCAKKIRHVEYVISDIGVEREDALRTELEHLLHLEAVSSAKRRRSRTVDESDFDSGFNEIAGRRKVDFARQLLSAVLYVVGGGAASWSVNLLTSDSPGGSPVIPAITAVACACIAAFVQFWPGWR